MKKSFLISALLMGITVMYAQQRISISDPNSQELYLQLKNFSQHNEGDSLSLDFFADKRYEAVVRRVTVGYDGMVGITAQILNTGAGYCYITVSDEGVAISAELPQKDEFFSNFQHKGEKYFSKHRLSDIQKNADGICEAVVPEPLKDKNERQKSFISNSLKPRNTQVTVRLMVVYTPAAKQYAASKGTSIDLIIDQAMQRSNLVMSNSLTDVTLQLVHKQEVDYVEASSLNADLNNITKTDDGHIDEVHLWRSRYQADLVVFIIGNTGSNVLGEAWILNDDEYGSPRSGFSVVRVTNVAESFTMVHEIGHNFGCGHHIETDKKGLYPYSHGRRSISDKGTRYSTIMTYETGSNYSHEPATIYPRIPYFSNPDISFEGSAIGENGKENNALTIRQTKTLISNYAKQLPYIDAFLKDMTTSDGTLQPAFQPATTQYHVTVGNHVTSIDITGTPNSPFSYVYNVTGRQLVEGDNVVEIKVESDWSDKKIYYVTVTRQKKVPPAPAVVFPTAQAVTYHPVQKLSDIALQNGSGDGKFAWANPGIVPTVVNSGYEVVFTPNDMINYDYSNIALRRSVQLVVNKAAQTITFPVIPEKQLTDAPFRVNASVDTGLPLSYESSDTNIAVIASDGTVTIKNAGTTTITVCQTGNENYLKSVEIQSLTVVDADEGEDKNEDKDVTTSVEIETIDRKSEYLYPNPVVRGGMLYMSIGADMPVHNAVIEIYDLAGNLKQRIPVNHGNQSLRSPAEPGIYLFVLKTGNDVKAVMRVMVN